MTTAQARAKWVRALRSGKFKQTSGALHDSTGYCCLGVACELFIPETAKQPKGSRTVSYGKPGEARSHSYVPTSVRDLLGLKTRLGRYGEFKNLAADNDDGVSFSEIAAIIESEPEGLFQ